MALNVQCGPFPCPEILNLRALGLLFDLQEAEHHPSQAVWVSVSHSQTFSHFPLDLKRRVLHPGLGLSLFPSQDRTCEAVEDTESGRMVRKMKKRICLVLDCLCAHDFSDKTADLINLQHYVIKEKRLSERETVVIFYDVVRVVEALHQVRPRALRASESIHLTAAQQRTAWSWLHQLCL